jgi:hypothetical protein
VKPPPLLEARIEEDFSSLMPSVFDWSASADEMAISGNAAYRDDANE